MQDFVALLIVTVSAVFLIRRGWQQMTRRRAGACGSCSHCAVKSSITSRSLITIASDFSHAKAPRREN
jgi:hypothetical protein